MARVKQNGINKCRSKEFFFQIVEIESAQNDKKKKKTVLNNETFLSLVRFNLKMCQKS